jgi:hypothetical protein
LVLVVVASTAVACSPHGDEREAGVSRMALVVEPWPAYADLHVTDATARSVLLVWPRFAPASLGVYSYSPRPRPHLRRGGSAVASRGHARWFGK